MMVFVWHQVIYPQKIGGAMDCVLEGVSKWRECQCSLFYVQTPKHFAQMAQNNSFIYSIILPFVPLYWLGYTNVDSCSSLNALLRRCNLLGLRWQVLENGPLLKDLYSLGKRHSVCVQSIDCSDYGSRPMWKRVFAIMLHQRSCTTHGFWSHLQCDFQLICK